jgi:hypothetical protein
VAATDITGEQSGNPGDADVHFGYHFVVTKQALDGSTGTVRLWRQKDAATTTGAIIGAAPADLTVEAGLQNIGGAYEMVVYSGFDSAVATLVDGSPTDGAVPVAATGEEVAAAVRSGGAAALAELAVSAAEARALAWTGPVATGGEASFTYLLRLVADSAPELVVTNLAYGPSSTGPLDRLRLTYLLHAQLFLPRVYANDG